MLGHVINVLDYVSVSQGLQEMLVKEVRLKYDCYYLMVLIRNVLFLATCPNDCSGHGTCSSIGDVSYFKGPDYNTQFIFSGDSYGPLYNNWDKEAITMCECDGGFFGSDCSMMMCPKGDDPLTVNQDNRYIRIHVRTKNARYEIGGVLGLRFQGETINFPLEYMHTTYTECDEFFSFKGKFGKVQCVQATRTYQYFTFDLKIESWPTFPKDTNLYSHNGNPSHLEFSCDIQYATETTTCQFEDLNSDNVRGTRWIMYLFIYLIHVNWTSCF